MTSRARRLLKSRAFRISRKLANHWVNAAVPRGKSHESGSSASSACSLPQRLRVPPAPPPDTRQPHSCGRSACACPSPPLFFPRFFPCGLRSLLLPPFQVFFCPDTHSMGSMGSMTLHKASCSSVLSCPLFQLWVPSGPVQVEVRHLHTCLRLHSSHVCHITSHLPRSVTCKS